MKGCDGNLFAEKKKNYSKYKIGRKPAGRDDIKIYGVSKERRIKKSIKPNKYKKNIKKMKYENRQTTLQERRPNKLFQLLGYNINGHRKY